MKMVNVYDDTAVTWGLALGIIWPITLIAFLLEKGVIELGRIFKVKK